MSRVFPPAAAASSYVTRPNASSNVTSTSISTSHNRPTHNAIHTLQSSKAAEKLNTSAKPTGKRKASTNSKSSKKKKKSKTSSTASDRPLTPFINFSNQHRSRIRAQNPSASFTDIGRLLGAQWRQLNDGQKAKYTSPAPVSVNGLVPGPRTTLPVVRTPAALSPSTYTTSPRPTTSTTQTIRTSTSTASAQQSKPINSHSYARSVLNAPCNVPITASDHALYNILKTLNLQSQYSKFKQQAIDRNNILLLSENDVRELLPLIGHRTTLLHWIRQQQQVKSESSEAKSNSTSNTSIGIVESTSTSVKQESITQQSNEQSTPTSSEHEVKECVVCLSNATHVVLPCCHICFCSKCANSFGPEQADEMHQNCPKCRHAIEQIKQVY